MSASAQVCVCVCVCVWCVCVCVPRWFLLRAGSRGVPTTTSTTWWSMLPSSRWWPASRASSHSTTSRRSPSASRSSGGSPIVTSQYYYGILGTIRRFAKRRIKHFSRILQHNHKEHFRLDLMSLSCSNTATAEHTAVVLVAMHVAINSIDLLFKMKKKLWIEWGSNNSEWYSWSSQKFKLMLKYWHWAWRTKFTLRHKKAFECKKKTLLNLHP